MAAPLQVAASSTGAVNKESNASPSSMVGTDDLLIVGPGVLGRLVAEKWQQWPNCLLFASDLFDPKLSSLFNSSKLKAFDLFDPVAGCNVTTREAASHWSGDGCFLFTSSTAPYDCFDNGPCDEDSPVVAIGRSPRTDVLLKAEKAALVSGGCVVRLAGLYNANRGAHMYWLEKGNVDARPDHILNLIHYEDAASLSVTILKNKPRNKIFLGTDNHPLPRQDVMDLVSKSGKFGKKFQGFTGTSDPLGKKLNNAKTRKELGWEPKYQSFGPFLGVTE